MSLSLVASSTLSSSAIFTNPLHYSNTKISSSIIHVANKNIAYTCCEQKQQEDNNKNHNIIDRRNVLLGIGGLYGGASAATMVNNKAMMAIAAHLSPHDHSKQQLSLPYDDKKLHAEVWSELVVELPADEIWAVYSSHDLPRLIVELLPTRFDKIDIVEGDGGVGTVLYCVLNPANSGPQTWKEKIIKMDDKTRTKVVRQIEGGYLGIGFHMYEHIFTITPKDANSCIIRMTASFDVDDNSASNASMIIPNWNMGKAIANYVFQSKANKHNAHGN